MRTGEATGGRRRRPQGVFPIRRPLLLRQQRRLQVGELRLHRHIQRGQEFSVHAAVGQQRQDGAGALGPVAQARVVLLLEALGGAAAQALPGRVAPLAAARGAVGVGCRVDVGLMHRGRVVAKVQRHGLLHRLPGRWVVAAQGRLPAQHGVFRP